MDFTYPVNIRFHCNKCGLCCGDTKQKTRAILVLETEAKKISAQTSQPITDFSTEAKNKLPYAFKMKKTSAGKCVFLREKQCSIYSLRPLICMFYPFELKFDKGKDLYIFDFTLECPGINQNRVFNRKDFEKLFEFAQERLIRYAGEHQPVLK